MINSETKKKLLKELQKTGNVYLSCLKVGIDKSTYYRWRKNVGKFRIESDKAIRIGRENNCDVAEHALMINVKNKKMDAIKYVLSHNSDRYKPKRSSSVVILHKTAPKELPKRDPTFKEFMNELNIKLNEEINPKDPDYKPQKEDLPLEKEEGEIN